MLFKDAFFNRERGCKMNSYVKNVQPALTLHFSILDISLATTVQKMCSKPQMPSVRPEAPSKPILKNLI